MAAIGFYHLTRTTLEEALPLLLGRTLDSGQRALVRCAAEPGVSAIDKALWAARRPDWLPHGTAASGHGTLQPIWITAGEDCPNGARFLFLLDGAAAPPGAWDRVFDLFDGRDEEAVAAARRRWAAAKAGGHELTYWRQGEAGWEKG